MVPPVSERHQGIEAELLYLLRPAAKRLGLKIRTDTGVFAADDDYRVPDLVVFSDEARSKRGVDGSPALAVEVRSPRDESFDKLPWYLERGATEVLIIDRDDLSLALYRSSGLVDAQSDGSVVLLSLGVRLSPADGNLLVDGVALDL